MTVAELRSARAASFQPRVGLRGHVSALVRDVRYAIRTLRRTPGFSTAVVFTMALGIAGTTVIIGAVNAVFLRGLPVPSADQLVALNERWSGGWSSTWMGFPMYSYEHYKDLRPATSDMFSDLVASRLDIVAARWSSNQSVSRNASIVSSNYFRALGVRAARGRVFADDDGSTRNAVVVISQGMWIRDFNMAASAIGQSIVVDSRPFVIIGIAPTDFRGTTAGLSTDLWVAAEAYRDGMAVAPNAPRQRFEVSIIGRLRSEVRAADAAKRLAPIVTALEPSTATRKLRSVSLDPFDGLPAVGRAAVVGFVSILGLTALLVTLVAAVNIAGMFLTRMAHRRREISVRLALGASRVSLLRQVCAETVLLSCIGAVVGIGTAELLARALPALHTPFAVDVSLDLSIDPAVAAMAVLVACGAGLVAGVLPVVHALREDMQSGLRSAGVSEPSRGTLRTTFVATQLALSLILLFTAGLFQRALYRAVTVQPGFDATNVVTAAVNAGTHGYDAQRATALFHELAGRLGARPEVAQVTFGNHLPLSGSYLSTNVPRPGESADPHRAINVMYGTADQSYFDVMRVPLVLGRGFRTGDDAGAPFIVVVNQALARRFWPGESPLGKTLMIAGADRTIVGVARDGLYQTLVDPPQPYAYIPIDQSPELSATMYVRHRGDDARALAALRNDLMLLNRNLALERPETLEAHLDTFRIPQRLAAWLVGLFGLVGLVIATVGLFAVLAFEVAQRTREFGVRLALGSSGSRIALDVIARSFRLLALSGAVGLVVAIGLGYLARAYLFGVTAFDPVVLAGVGLVLGFTALIASVLPAVQASRIDPIVCLRME